MVITKQNQLQDLPPMLVLHIKRFHYDPEMGTQKLRRRVTYGSRLQIRSEMVSPSRRDKLPEYLLVGVVYHHGMHTAGGHYTCDVRRQDGQWIRINDTVIKPIAESEVCVSIPSSIAEDTSIGTGSNMDWNGWSHTTEGDAYLLFYMDASLYSTTTITATAATAVKTARLNSNNSHSTLASRKRSVQTTPTLTSTTTASSSSTHQRSRK
ncbi:hypothetical protein BDF19DRAFT_67430 [Syncephalis fuscata]|nr:hypothetical protein BDF19DRAFT_67430 [Syncephalis fuscata]